MTHLIVMVGLPGSGKSTLRNNWLASNPDMLIASTDDIIQEYADAEGLTYNHVWADNIKQATKVYNAEIQEAIKVRRPVLVDRTNLTIGSRHKLLNAFPTEYAITIINVLPPETPEEIGEWLRRLDSREGKNIPMSILSNMLFTYEPPVYAEHVDDIIDYDMYGMRK